MIMDDVINRVIPDLYGVIRLPDVRRTIFRHGDKRMRKRSVYRFVGYGEYTRKLKASIMSLTISIRAYAKSIKEP